MRTRNWSIRSKIIALLAVPLTALLALWIFATVLTAGPALNLLSAQTLLDTVGNPGEVLVGDLQKERRASVVYLSTADPSPGTLATQRAATDRAAADFRSAAGSERAQDAASPALRARIAQILTDLDALPGNRRRIDSRRIDAVGAQDTFDGIIDTGFQMFAATATFNDEQIDRQIRALTSLGHGQEYLSRADSLLAGADAAGRFDPAARRRLLASLSTAQFLLADGVHDLPGSERATYRTVSTGTAFGRLRQLQDTLVGSSRPGEASPVTAAQWQPAYDRSAQQLRAFELSATAALARRATPVAVRILLKLGIAGLLGLLALVASVVVSVRVGRSLIGRLRRLRAEALEMAGERLPAVVGRLRRGEAVDVDVEAPPLEYGTDEIGEVGRAFTEVQRTAVQSAVDEANVRRGVNEVFLNIARRSQTLLHRQLALLDRMERRETGPQELEDLYRVDHLATRMRRHAEDLVILAGAAPGRGWRNPVPVIDVVRGAISEVEDYRRADVRAVESSAILGRAVGDVIHLLAELLENAASFSPPHTRVVVGGQLLPNGYAVEIEDRGLGMSPEAIQQANRRLREPPDFDPADSARLGLFVVAQLAARHGIRVTLRPSAYGGVMAIVLIPRELVTAGPEPLALPAGPSAVEASGDRPLVGTGTDDPSRHSLASLQWRGAQEPRSITVPGRLVGGDGAAAESLVEDPPPAGGPSPGTVVQGLSADGLVQRRRTVARRQPAGPQPARFPAGLETPDALLSTGAAAAPGASSAGAGMPKRVRQASLAPQLRAPAAEPTAASARSPEQVRSLMSALQRGTTRGRLAAAGAAAGGPGGAGVTGGAGGAGGADDRSAPPRGDVSFADAATVTLPVVREPRDEPPDDRDTPDDRETTDAGAGSAADVNQATRPEKDA
jgi:signal transduction histidine kinase